jgi:hypothetical protein
VPEGLQLVGDLVGVAVGRKRREGELVAEDEGETGIARAGQMRANRIMALSRSEKQRQWMTTMTLNIFSKQMS